MLLQDAPGEDSDLVNDNGFQEDEEDRAGKRDRPDGWEGDEVQKRSRTDGEEGEAAVAAQAEAMEQGDGEVSRL